MFLSHPIETTVTAAFAILIAAAARRLTGFGFALIGAPLLSMILPPQHVVAVVLLLQVFLGVPTAFEFRNELEWPVLRQLALGGVFTSPIGVFVLAYADPDDVLLVMGICVIVAASILGVLPNLIKIQASRPANIACGMLAGLMSSSVGMPGPAVAIFFMGQPNMSLTKRRAMLIATFSLLASVSLVMALSSGQVKLGSFWLAIVLLGPALAGGYLGEVLLKHLDRTLVERVAVCLVFLTGLLCIVRSF